MKAERSEIQKQNALPIAVVDETKVSKITKLISLPKHSSTIYLKNDKEREIKENFRKSPLENYTTIKTSVKEEKENGESLKKDKLNETQNNKQEELFCACKKPNDGQLYVLCETCNMWLHPKCVFDNDHLALTLTKKQWERCRCICKGKNITNVHAKNPVNCNEKQIFYHKSIFTTPVKDNDSQQIHCRRQQ